MRCVLASTTALVSVSGPTPRARFGDEAVQSLRDPPLDDRHVLDHLGDRPRIGRRPPLAQLVRDGVDGGAQHEALRLQMIEQLANARVHGTGWRDGMTRADRRKVMRGRCGERSPLEARSVARRPRP
jgi:hypothetical protein